MAMCAASVAACGGERPTDTQAEDTGEPAEANQAPIAVDDSAVTRTEQIVEIDVTDNDSDPNRGDRLIVAEITQPAHGFVRILGGEKRVSYQSAADFVGVDQFTYTVSDELGLTDTANVAVNVQALPTIVITAPVEGSRVEGPTVTVSFEVDGCPITRPSANPDGCHLHRYLDGAGYSDETSSLGHYDPTPFQISPLADGDHQFTLVLAVNDGSDQAMEPRVEAIVNFRVGPPE
jgi:hypothetical protein